MKALIIYDSSFPYQGIRPSQKQIEILQTIGDVVSPLQLTGSLRENEYSGIVNLHGGYFMKDSWKEIMEHLRRGCGSMAGIWIILLYIPGGSLMTYTGTVPL